VVYCRLKFLVFFFTFRRTTWLARGSFLRYAIYADTLRSNQSRPVMSNTRWSLIFLDECLIILQNYLTWPSFQIIANGRKIVRNVGGKLLCKLIWGTVNFLTVRTKPKKTITKKLVESENTEIYFIYRVLKMNDVINSVISFRIPDHHVHSF